MQTGNFFPGAATGQAVPQLSPPPCPYSLVADLAVVSPSQPCACPPRTEVASSSHPCTPQHPCAPHCALQLQQPGERPQQAAKIPLPKPSLAMHSRHPQLSHPTLQRCSRGPQHRQS